MNIYVYKLWQRACPYLWTSYAVRADSAEEAGQWHNWKDAPRHDSAVLVGVVEVSK